MARTLFEKIWDEHVVADLAMATLTVDLESTSESRTFDFVDSTLARL